MKHIKRIIFAVICITIFFGLQRLLVPKYMSSIFEGALIAEYYKDPKLHDVIFIGDCEVYSNISPVILWKNYGISSHIRGAPQQLIWQSYYLLRDTLRFETPSVVVLSVLAMKYDEPQNEAYNRLNIDGMRFSRYKLGAAKASATDGESVLSYIFPLFRFHDRWRDINAYDFRYFFRRGRVGIAGYMLRADVRPAGFIPGGRRLPDYSFGEKSFKYLERITALCRENNIKLVLFKAPSLYPYWHSAWDEQIVHYAKENGLLYINTLEHLDEIGIDFSIDTFNGGLHLNVYGAEKLADFLGKILQNYVPDRRLSQEHAALWDERIRAYNWLKEVQQREFIEYGRILTFRWK
ncbi:MAG: SGNH/GDSL hydrolase family protein [Defluviitaleaceae bacterium]|nr:SGNH/GDSL hydrolase family protein [Defluviitaleaceae bacterium]